jgi:hypothetical protein
MSGTQSPPLELTGEEKTLGAPATNKPAGVASVKMDSEQRRGELGISYRGPFTRSDYLRGSYILVAVL